MEKTPEIKLTNDYGRNYIINGNFDFWQRATTFVAASGIYTADRFRIIDASSGVVDITRDTDVPTLAESGYQSLYSLKVDVTTADASPGNEGMYIEQKIEGNNYQPIHSKIVILSFWVKSNKTGQYSVTFRNSASDRSYTSPYIIDDSNTWEKKEITLTLDDTGTWLFDNTIGLRVAFGLLAGNTFNTADANKNQWNGFNATGLDTDVNFLDDTSNEFFIAQVQLTEGAEDIPFRRAGKTITEELCNCQRYYELVALNAAIPVTGGFASWPIAWRVEKRAIPATALEAGSFSSGATILESPSTRGFRLTVSGPVATSVIIDGIASADAEL